MSKGSLIFKEIKIIGRLTPPVIVVGSKPVANSGISSGAEKWIPSEVSELVFLAIKKQCFYKNYSP